LVNETVGERLVIDFFTDLLGIVLICALFGIVTKVILRPLKVRDEKDWIDGALVRVF
jgi:predicted outer membrane lipoprotein